MSEVTLVFDEPVKKVRSRKTEQPKEPKKKLTKKDEKINQILGDLKIPNNYHLISTTDEMIELYEDLRYYLHKNPNGEIFLDTETYGINPFKDKIISISLGFNNQYYNIPLVPFKHPDYVGQSVPERNATITLLKEMFENHYNFVLHNSKFDIHVLFNSIGLDLMFNIGWDTMIAAKLLDENSSASLKDWYMNYAIPHMVENGHADETSNPTFKFGDTFNKTPFDQIPVELATYYACHDVFMTQKVYEYQKHIFNIMSARLSKVYNLFREVEMPVIPVLVNAERKGIRLDTKFLTEVIGGVLKEKATSVENEILDLLGRDIKITKKKTRTKDKVKYQEEYEVIEELNLSSPKQIMDKLYFEHKVLEPVMEYDKELKKEIEKYKTDKKTLVKNKKKHKSIELLLEYRGLIKLIDAFVNSLPEAVIDGRIHPSFNSMVRTGRMSCSNPNLCGAV